MTLTAPLLFHHNRKSVHDDIDKAAHDQAEENNADIIKYDHNSVPILKIGKYIATINNPAMPAKNSMMTGSSHLLK